MINGRPAIKNNSSVLKNLNSVLAKILRWNTLNLNKLTKINFQVVYLFIIFYLMTSPY